MGSVFRVVLAVACLCTALEAQTSSRFAVYERCRFADDLQLVENTPLAKGVEGRTVKTVMGPRQVPLAGGVRLMYAYPNTEPLANVKIEHIPADGYAQAKQDLIANFDQILTADDSSTRNYALKPKLNGLEIYGLDRQKLEGGVLGIYLFFVDSTHTAVTIYFLNQDPAVRRFSSLEEYATLRDAFVETFTGCAAGHLRPAMAASTGAADPSAVPAAVPANTPALIPDAGTLPDAPLPNGVHAEAAAPAPEPAITSKPATSKPATKKPAVSKPARKSPVKSTHAIARKPGAAHTSRKPVPVKTEKKKT